MKRRHRALVAAGLLAPACTTPTAVSGSRGTPQTSAPEDTAAASASGAGPTTTAEPPTTIPPTTVTITAPPEVPATIRRATTTTVAVAPFVLPEAPTKQSDADWWASQPGACGGSLPPCAVMRRESGGDPTVYNSEGSGASGKWQFMPSTWAGYGGYANAADAPEAVQDERARQLWAGGQGCSHWAAC